MWMHSSLNDYRHQRRESVFLELQLQAVVNYPRCWELNSGSLKDQVHHFSSPVFSNMRACMHACVRACVCCVSGPENSLQELVPFFRHVSWQQEPLPAEPSGCPLMRVVFSFLFFFLSLWVLCICGLRVPTLLFSILLNRS